MIQCHKRYSDRIRRILSDLPYTLQASEEIKRDFVGHERGHEQAHCHPERTQQKDQSSSVYISQPATLQQEACKSEIVG